MPNSLARSSGFLALVTLLAGCANPPPSLTRTDLLHAEWFPLHNDNGDQITPTKQVLKLSAESEATLDRALSRSKGGNARVEVLLKSIFGPNLQDFGYQPTVTTTAERTFQHHSGNCLSLALMTLALADRLGLAAQLQEVTMPPIWERQAGHIYINGHVNVLVRGNPFNEGAWFFRPDDMEIDFDPDLRSTTRGFIASVPISRHRGLAMFYSNRGAEAYSLGQHALAFANYLRATQLDPNYDGAWFNLSVLYLQQGHQGAAEEVLRHVLSVNPESYPALTQMQRLLTARGSDHEADVFSARIRAMHDSDPNYLYKTGTEQLARGEIRAAIKSLERATKLGVGYEEFHRALRDAYRASGDIKRATGQAELLTELDRVKPANKKVQILSD